MRKIGKALVAIVATIAVTTIVVPRIEASSTITVKQFVKDLEKKTGTDVETKATGKLTNEVAAELLVQAYHQKNGSISVKKNKLVHDLDGSSGDTKMTLAFDEVLDDYSAARASNVYKYKRISDLNKASKGYKKDLILAYAYGLMGGKSNGTYSQNRSMNPKSKVTTTTAKKYIGRVAGTEEPLVVAPDGQLTRNTNLPKNAANFRWILASFPNSYYEMVPVPAKIPLYAESISEEFYDANTVGNSDGCYITVSKDGVSQLNMFSLIDVNGGVGKDKIVDVIKTNLEQKLNVSYKTIDKKWQEKLANTYKSHYNYDAIRKDISTYAEAMKKNKVIIKSDKIVVEPSGMYRTNGSIYVRCYVEFTVKSAKSTEDCTAHNTVIGFSFDYNKTYKVGKKVKAYVDVPVWRDHKGNYYINGGTRFIDAATAPKLTKSIFDYKLVESKEFGMKTINCKKQY